MIALEAATDAGPFPVCGASTPAFAALEGLRIGRQVRGDWAKPAAAPIL